MTHEYDPTDYDSMLWRPDAVAAVCSVREVMLADRVVETTGLAGIGGRTLTEAVVAPEDRPTHDHATMDGFAFDATEGYPFEVVSSVFPEDSPPEIEAGEAVEIATGAPLPEHANAVLKHETATTDRGQLRGVEIEPGTDVYRRASTVTAGETLFEAGERLSPKDAILLRDIGIEQVPVHERFGVGVLATGTEIDKGRDDDLDSPMLCGLVDSWGGEPVYEGTVPDELAAVTDRIAALADRYDVVLTSGGTSVGQKDYVIRALVDLGDLCFHQVRIRPGKPIALARLPEYDAVAFALPGKPIAAHTAASFVLRPFFTGNGRLPTIEATLARDIEIDQDGFEYAVPVTLRDSKNGAGSGPEAMPLGHVDSTLAVYEEHFDPSVLASSTRATRADGVFLTRSRVEAGGTVPVISYGVLE